MTDVGTHAELEQRRQYEDSTGCQGRMIVIAEGAVIWELECETCGFQAGLPARGADPLFGRRLREQQAGFPARFASVRVQEDEHNRMALRELRGWLQRFADRPLPAPALCGDAGRGKSQLLVALGQRLVRERAVSVLFRSTGRLLDEMQDEFDRSEAGGRVWDRAVSAPVLLLDDVGAERGTDWRLDRLARLVDERWERELPVVVATNFRPGLWGEAFDARTASRLRGMTFVVEVGGPDRRQLVLSSKQEG